MTSTNIVSLLHLHASKLGFQRLGVYPNDIISHYLCSGGAINLHQAHIPGSTIKTIGRWHSDTFLIYLQGYVVTFTKGVATAMKKLPGFTTRLTCRVTPLPLLSKYPTTQTSA